MARAGVQVQPPVRGALRRQRLQVGDDDRALVDVDGLDRQPGHALGQRVGAGEQAQAQRLGVQPQQLGGVVREIPDDQLVAVGRVGGQRPDQCQPAALDAVHARDMQQRPPLRLRAGDLGLHRLLPAQAQAEVEQPRLRLAQRPRQADGGAHVRQRVMRVLVHDAVGHAQVFQPEGRPPVRMARPVHAFRPQRPGAAHHVDQIPAAAAVLPLARVGVDQVAPEQVAGELVVEAQRVVAQRDGAGPGHLGLDRGGEGVLGQALRQRLLRQDAGQQAAFRVRQVVRRGLAEVHDRRPDLAQLGVGADRGELRGTITAGIASEGLVVVPEEGEVCVGHARHLNRSGRQPRRVRTHGSPPMRRKLGKRGRPWRVWPRQL